MHVFFYFPRFPWKCNYKKGIHVELVIAFYLYISFSNIEETEVIVSRLQQNVFFLSFNNPSLSIYKVSVVKASSLSAKASPALIAESSRVGNICRKTGHNGWSHRHRDK